MKKWDVHLMPDLTGKIVIVTGGNTGLGFQSCLELARKNATVIIACRTIAKGELAVTEIRDKIGAEAKLNVMQLDLSDYDSIKSFADGFKAKYQQLHILMNNAGVVNQKEKGTTRDGSETHMGTNHFGHFALTGHLIPLLLRTPKARVVTMSSGGYKSGNIRFDDLNWDKRPYHRVKSYGDSKLANLLFTLKLQQYFERKGADAMAVSAHPGLSASPRQQAIGIGGKLTKWLASPLERGSRPQLLAATAPFVKPLDYYGPRYGVDGPPKFVRIKHEQYNMAIADKLWKVSEEITGVRYNW
ncbi:SDR family NAD(P)-dependent oxidoreductase [Prolixibacteraceae bacterium JC049]|nr:SDR family NAD(P)-dependent oxidoreductase [Prolixibacteraceae bacterium JC049]